MSVCGHCIVMNSLKSSKSILNRASSGERERNSEMGLYREGLILSILVQWATGNWFNRITLF